MRTYYVFYTEQEFIASGESHEYSRWVDKSPKKSYRILCESTEHLEEAFDIIYEQIDKPVDTNLTRSAISGIYEDWNKPNLVETYQVYKAITKPPRYQSWNLYTLTKNGRLRPGGKR